MTKAENRNDIMYWCLRSATTNHPQGQQHASTCSVASTWLSTDTLEALASTSSVSSQAQAPLHEVAAF
ncbi:TPA: hypothetical protein ACGVBV_004238 [Vibrio vulnificus]